MCLFICLSAHLSFYLSVLCIDICWYCRANIVFSWPPTQWWTRSVPTMSYHVAWQQSNSEQGQSLPGSIMFLGRNAVLNKVSPCHDLRCSLAERNSEEGQSLPRCKETDRSWQGLTLFTIALLARKLIDHGRDWPCSLPRQWEGNWYCKSWQGLTLFTIVPMARQLKDLQGIISHGVYI